MCWWLCERAVQVGFDRQYQSIPYHFYYSTLSDYSHFRPVLVLLQQSNVIGRLGQDRALGALGDGHAARRQQFAQFRDLLGDAKAALLFALVALLALDDFLLFGGTGALFLFGGWLLLLLVGCWLLLFALWLVVRPAVFFLWAGPGAALRSSSVL